MSRPWEYRASDLLNQHLARTGGLTRAVMDSPLANLQIEILRCQLSVLESALDDEGIAPDVIRRIIQLMIYGCVPDPAAATEHAEMMKRMAKMSAIFPIRTVLSQQRLGEGGINS